MTQPIKTPAAPSRRGRWIALAVVVILGLLEFMNHFIAKASARANADFVGGVNGAVRFDQSAVDAAYSSNYWSTMLVLNMAEICPAIILAIFFIALRSMRRPKAAAPATKKTSTNE